MDSVMANSQLFIDGRWVPAASGKTAKITCPADGKVIAEISIAGMEDVERAVVAAHAAFCGSWAATPGRVRGILLNRLADLVERDATVLAKLEALDIGRPFNEPLMVDIPSAVATLRTFAGWADKIDGRVIPGPDHFGRPVHSYTTRVPVGVIGAILPWNAPTMIACWKLAPALASGCTIVVKPALEAPLAVLYLARLAEEAGIPAGVINVLPGTGREIGTPLVSHPLVAKVTFTGSPAVGREIARLTADAFKPVTLELGGKAPQIVFEDADIGPTAHALGLGIFSNQGEICAAGSRILVHRSLEGKLVEALTAEANARVLGHPLDVKTTMGSLINQKQFETVSNYIKIGKEEGAVLAAGGEALSGPGYFMRPTVFKNVRNSMRIAREEIFGPVAAVMIFDSEEQAVSMANDSAYGLSANIWTENVRRAHRVAEKIKAGTVWVNGGGTPDPRAVWGGSGLSGIGRELGSAAIQSHTHEKAVCLFL